MFEKRSMVVGGVVTVRYENVDSDIGDSCKRDTRLSRKAACGFVFDGREGLRSSKDWGKTCDS